MNARASTKSLLWDAQERNYDYDDDKNKSSERVSASVCLVHHQSAALKCQGFLSSLLTQTSILLSIARVSKHKMPLEFRLSACCLGDGCEREREKTQICIMDNYMCDGAETKSPQSLLESGTNIYQTIVWSQTGMAGNYIHKSFGAFVYSSVEKKSTKAP